MILGGDIVGGVALVQHHGVILIWPLDFAVVIPAFQILSRLGRQISRNKILSMLYLGDYEVVTMLILGRDIGSGLTLSTSHDVQFYFSRLYGTNTSEAIF